MAKDRKDKLRKMVTTGVDTFAGVQAPGLSWWQDVLDSGLRDFGAKGDKKQDAKETPNPATGDDGGKKDVPTFNAWYDKQGGKKTFNNITEAQDAYTKEFGVKPGKVK